MFAMERCLMSKQRRSFSPEFKAHAACLVLDKGYSHIEAMTPDQQRIQELEARIDRLEREKAILKKATALLMSEGIERTS